MRKSKTNRSAADARASKAVNGSVGAESSGDPNKSKLAPKRRVAGGKVSRPVQLSLFDYAAAIGVTLLPEAS